MYHFALIGYMLWRYSYVFEYTYSALYYGNAIRHYVFDKQDKIEEDTDDWLLIERKDPCVILQEVDIPDELP